MEMSPDIKELAIALNLAQADMAGAKKGKENSFFKSSYADMKSVVEAIREPFGKNGLSYVQFPIEDGGRIGIETILMHVSGQWMKGKFTVNLNKQDAQGAGSAITYCRRYSLQAVAGIPSEDDDGNVASPKQVPQQTLPPYNPAPVPQAHPTFQQPPTQQHVQYAPQQPSGKAGRYIQGNGGQQ